jgi:hypothetical protein
MCNPAGSRRPYAEVAMIDFERFWREGYNPYGAPEEEAPPGVTAEEIRAWEGEHGVTLPEPLRTALGLRNGGSVRNTSISVLSLGEIVPVDDDFWEWAGIDAEEAPDRGLVFVFGHDEEVGGTYLMNFNAQDRYHPPRVYIHHHGESTYLVSDSIGDLFESRLASSVVPAVNWSEAMEDLPVVARETIDLSALWEGKPASLDQILARQGEALVLFTRERSPEGEVLTRTRLPLPLHAPWAGIRPRRPGPPATFALHLPPVESDGIVKFRSETNDDGRWKNTTSHGASATFESTDRDRLRALRTQLLGDEGAGRAQASEDRLAALHAALEATLELLAPEQRSAAMTQVVLAMRLVASRRFAEQFGDPGPMPAGLAGAAEATRRNMEEITEEIRQESANPIDPEVVRWIEDLLRGPWAERANPTPAPDGPTMG